LVVALIFAAVALLWLMHERSVLCANDADSERAKRMLSAVEFAAGDALWEVSADGVITYVSAGAPDILGPGTQRLVGNHIDRILPEHERQRGTQLLADGAVAGGWQDQEFTYITTEGDEIVLLSTAVANIGPNGQVVGFTGTIRRRDEAIAARRDRDEAQDRITSILDRRAVQIVFQPIIDVQSGRVVGAEALSRFLLDPVVAPDRIFADAASVGLGVELELLAIEEALLEGRQLPRDVYVSVNVSPHTVLSGQLERVLSASGWDPRRLIIEITEHVSVADYDCVNAALSPLRVQGIRLAVDDAGAGYASFQHILKLRPDFIKLDRGLVAGIESDPAQRALVAAVATFARDVGRAARTVLCAGLLHRTSHPCGEHLGQRDRSADQPQQHKLITGRTLTRSCRSAMTPAIAITLHSLIAGELINGFAPRSWSAPRARVLGRPPRRGAHPARPGHRQAPGVPRSRCGPRRR
jgi:PAS domain S-box-containing protein